MFLLSKLVIALISPLGASLLGGLLAIFLVFSNRKRLSVYLGALALFWLWFWSMPVSSNWMRGYLEDQNPPMAVQDVPEAQAIVVLGGGISPAGHQSLYPNLESAADRVWHAARLFHASKAPLVLLSGGSDPEYSRHSEAEAMRQFIVDLGVPAQAILLEQDSRNTAENARHSSALLAEQGVSSILLVTSALHMPRARALFEAQGLQVIPVATDHDVHPRPVWRNLLPDTAALDGSSRAIKEIVGHWIGQAQR